MSGDLQENPARTQRGSQANESSLPPMTLNVAAHFLYFHGMMERIKTIDGDVVECGIGWGRSLALWAYLVRLEDKKRQLWGFDSFEGFPEPAAQDQSVRNTKKGEWKTSLESVMKMLNSSELDPLFVSYQITLVKGFFKDSLAKHTGKSIALLHVDADLYESYRDVLEQLYPKVAIGGAILFDEYMNTMEHEKFPGARKAIDEFFKGGTKIQRDALSGKYFVIKEK